MIDGVKRAGMHLKKLVFIIPAGFIIASYVLAWRPQVANTAPKVLILKPSEKEKFKWNSLIGYAILVSDKEDGSSEYNEIDEKEILLKIMYIRDPSRLAVYRANEAKQTKEPSELTLIKKSTCFNCHAVKSKLIGPSFEAITKRYPNNSTSVAILANRVMKGSKGIWGSEIMPPHPELQLNQATDIVRWLTKTGADPNVDYLRGLEGTFRTRPMPAKNTDKAAYVLTASYTDHGSSDRPQQTKSGKHIVVLKSN